MSFWLEEKKVVDFFFCAPTFARAIYSTYISRICSSAASGVRVPVCSTRRLTCSADLASLCVRFSVPLFCGMAAQRNEQTKSWFGDRTEATATIGFSVVIHPHEFSLCGSTEFPSEAVPYVAGDQLISGRAAEPPAARHGGFAEPRLSPLFYNPASSTRISWVSDHNVGRPYIRSPCAGRILELDKTLGSFSIYILFVYVNHALLENVSSVPATFS